MTSRAFIGAVAFAVALVSGCERQMRDMYAQPRFDPDEGSTLWPDGRADRPPAPGSIAAAAGTLAGTSSARHGHDALGAARAADDAQSLPPITNALLARGHERYSIDCLPCHSPLGDGDGPVVRHGFPQPPNYREPRLRAAPDRYIFDVITQGHGVMYGYAGRIAPQDRWAIVAYVRALQQSPIAQPREAR